MRAAIHQPHYFPWIGYFDKLAKADQFILLDEVQFEKGSQMIRNRVLDNNGEIKYLTIMGETKGFLDKKYNELKTKDNAEWQKRQRNSLENYYRKSQYKDEMLEQLDTFFSLDYNTVCEWTCESIMLVCRLLGIETEICYQSDIVYDRSRKQSDLVLSLCESVRADTYFSGRGASVDYLDREAFRTKNISILFQNFAHPVYAQVNTETFVPGLSILDAFFNLGIEGTRERFWDNVRKESLEELQ